MVDNIFYGFPGKSCQSLAEKMIQSKQLLKCEICECYASRDRFSNDCTNVICDDCYGCYLGEEVV